MTRYHSFQHALAGMVCLALACTNTILGDETTKVQGIIKARSGANMILQTSDAPSLVVTLTDSTQVSQIQGVFKARRKEMSMAALIPGLAVQVEGTYAGQNHLLARSVKFKGDDLAQAKAIQAGLHETHTQAQQNKADLEKQNAELEKQNAELRAHQEQLATQQQKIAAAVARFGQLDDYYILDEMMVYFANGKVALETKYKPELLKFAEKAKTVESYMIQIVGYASSVGNEDLNQKLSEDRAHNVTNFLVQKGNIPLTNMLAPGAMGESRQVGNGKTAEGEAQNRRVVVRVLQNKGIAGTSASGL